MPLLRDPERFDFGYWLKLPHLTEEPVGIAQPIITFRRTPDGSFNTWLKLLAQNKVRRPKRIPTPDRGCVSAPAAATNSD